MHRNGRSICGLCRILALLLLLCLLPPVEVQAAEADTVVRVGYVISENFQEGEEGQRKDGYGYEYLQRLSYYTGWRYEYVYGNFAELLAQLEQGEIDLLPNLNYTEERAENILFSAEAQGEERFTLYTYAGGTLLDPSDYSTFQGIRVGIKEECYQNIAFQDWCDARGIQCEIITYVENDQRMEDFANGDLDAVVATREYTENPWVPVIQVGTAPYYFGVSMIRPDLLAQLDAAMEELFAAEPYFNDDLRTKYVSTTTATQRTINQEEQEFLDQTSEIRIGYLTNFMPYCGVNEETAELDGLLGDLLATIQREYATEFANTKFTTYSYDSYSEMRQALDDGLVDAVFPCYGDLNVGEAEQIMFTKPVTTTTMTVFNKETHEKAVSRIALCADDPLQGYYAEIYYPDAQWVYFDDWNSCVKAVATGDAEFTVVETALSCTVQNSLKSQLQQSNLLDTVDLCMAVSWGSRALRSILDKGILSMDSSAVSNSLVYHSRQNISYTREDFLRDHMVETLVIMAAIFLVIIGLLVLIFLSHTRSQKRIWNAEIEVKSQRWRAEHDPLTGLLNRAALQKLSQQYENSDMPLGLVICDVDNFKDVNDTYGHEIGDQALIKVAQLLRQTFRNVDSVLRYAGDEFVVLMVHATPEGKTVIGGKIDAINQVLQNPEGQLPKLSISAGVAFSPKGYGEDLLQNADQALYQTKAAGRCGYTFYEN